MKPTSDIIICYARDDDDTYTGNDRGWVSEFIFFLELMLRKAGHDREFRFFTFTENQLLTLPSDNSHFIFIPVISPVMVRQEVLTSFIDNTIGELRNRYTMKRLQSPVFPVIKAPVDFNSLPPSLCSVLPVDFFEIDSLSEEVKIFESSRECKDRQFMMKIYELANTICQRLLKYEESPVSFNFERQAPAIFLADTGKDLKLHREGLKRELLRFGYDVYPQNPLPEHYDDMVHSIREDLRRCCLSIHLMGEDFGPVVTGSNYSIVELQNQVAADYCNELMEDPNATAFNRIVWVPQHTRHISFKQQNYLMTLKKDVRSILNTEFLQTPVEEFKSFVKKKL
ncbi:MAG: hypothetical protein WBG62_10330, partial [Cyclobacteriaceae bacterium]